MPAIHRIAPSSIRGLTLSLLTGLFASSFTGPFAHAYIPHGQTIVNRVGHTHGKGVYVIDQDVQFRTSTEPLILHEHWVVENGEDMRVTVTAPQSGSATGKGAEPIRYDVIYRAGRRTVNDPGGGVKTLPLSTEFVEGVFHARSGHTILMALVNARILPAAFMRDRARPTKIEQIKYQPEPYMRLGREAGVVAWIFGEPSPVDGKMNPEAWVEQDAFTLRKLRFPSEAEVTADRYSSYPNGLRLPRERNITWDTSIATIRLISVRSIPASQLGQSLDPASLNKAKQARLPDLSQVREFYSRFR